MLKKYNNWITIVSNLCLFVGVMLLIIVFLRNEMVSKKQIAFIEEYQEEQKEKDELADVLPDTTQVLREETNKIDSNDTSPIGILSIPKIDLKTAVLEGVNNNTLRYAVGHYENTPLPNEEGNFCIVGHRSYSYGEFFNRLNEMEIGDGIYMESSGITYTYKVADILLVNPEDTWVLDSTEDSMITLITCTPIRIGSHRLIIKGILEDTTESKM